MIAKKVRALSIPLWICLLTLGTLLPRIWLLSRYQSCLIESDEAIAGLMARHLLSGEWSVFYWGQTYMGTLEASVTALLFSILGATPLVLKLTSLLFFTLFGVVHYHLARQLLPRSTSLLATSLVVVSPAFLTIWSLKSRGGYSTLLLLGTAGLLLASRIPDSRRLHDFLFLGLVLGAAWWSHPLSAVYMIPICLFLLGVWVWRRIGIQSREDAVDQDLTAVSNLRHDKAARGHRTPKASEGPRWTLGFGLFAAGFVTGSLPFWVYNLRHFGASFQQPGRQATSFLSDLWNLFGIGLPILMGARPNWTVTDLFPFAGFLVVSLVLISTGIVIGRRLLTRNSSAQYPRLLILGFLLLFPLLFSASGFAWFVMEPRYLIPLYSVVYIVILAALPQRRLRIAVWSALLALNLVGTFLITHAEFVGYTNVEPTQELIEFLQDRQIDRVFAPYWVAYRLSFESGETIIASPPPGDVIRYVPYLTAVQNASRRAYVQLNLPRYEGLNFKLEIPSGYRFQKVGSYDVFLPE